MLLEKEIFVSKFKDYVSQGHILIVKLKKHLVIILCHLLKA